MDGNSDVAPTGLGKHFPGRSYPRLARHGPHDAARFAGFRMALILKLALMGRWPGLWYPPPLGLEGQHSGDTSAHGTPQPLNRASRLPGARDLFKTATS